MLRMMWLVEKVVKNLDNEDQVDLIGDSPSPAGKLGTHQGLILNSSTFQPIGIYLHM